MISHLTLSGKIALPLIVLSVTMILFRLSGYDSPGSMASAACTEEIHQGVVVYLTNSVTGTPITTPASVSITDGDYHSVLSNRFGKRLGASQDRRAFIGAPERKGTYTLRVCCPGYASQEKTGIEVTWDNCHVRTQTVCLSMEPLLRKTQGTLP